MKTINSDNLAREKRLLERLSLDYVQKDLAFGIFGVGTQFHPILTIAILKDWSLRRQTLLDECTYTLTSCFSPILAPTLRAA